MVGVRGPRRDGNPRLQPGIPHPTQNDPSAGVGEVSLVLRESGWATTMTATIGDLTFTAQVAPSWARGWITVTLDGQQRNALLADLHAATTATVWLHAEPSGVTVHPHTEF